MSTNILTWVIGMMANEKESKLQAHRQYLIFCGERQKNPKSINWIGLSTFLHPARIGFRSPSQSMEKGMEMLQQWTFQFECSSALGSSWKEHRWLVWCMTGWGLFSSSGCRLSLRIYWRRRTNDLNNLLLAICKRSAVFFGFNVYPIQQLHRY